MDFKASHLTCHGYKNLENYINNILYICIMYIYLYIYNVTPLINGNSYYH